MDTTTQDNPDYIAIRPEVKKLIDIARQEKWKIINMGSIYTTLSKNSSNFPHISVEGIRLCTYNFLSLYDEEVKLVVELLNEAIDIRNKEKQDFAMQDLRKYLEGK